MNRSELADFLRRSRERIDPAAVGLAPRARVRTPGLRREDIAQMAGISVDYYARLEQARGPHPSDQVLGALARALRLTDDECDHLYRLAGQQPRSRFRSSDHVGPGLLLILDRLHDTPAQVSTDFGQLLARNAMAEALFGGRDGMAIGENLVWRHFTDPEEHSFIPPEDRERIGRSHVANLRAILSKRPDDQRIVELLDRLLAASPRFAELWEQHDVAVLRSSHKNFDHPLVGRLELDCETLLTDPGDQRLVVFTARPGTETHDRLALLRVIGAEQFA